MLLPDLVELNGLTRSMDLFLTHIVPLMPHGILNPVTIDSGNRLLPDGTKSWKEQIVNATLWIMSEWNLLYNIQDFSHNKPENCVIEVNNMLLTIIELPSTGEVYVNGFSILMIGIYLNRIWNAVKLIPTITAEIGVKFT